MTAQPKQPLPGLPPVEVDEQHQADVDGFVERNREALNASIRRSRAELARGVRSRRTIGEIIKDGRSKNSQG